MKKTLRVLTLSALTLTFVAAPQVSTFAQDAAAATQTQERDALYTEKFLKNIAKGATDQQRATAYEAAKEYMQKYGNDADNADIKTYLQKWIPKYEEAEKLKAKQARYVELEKAYQAKDWARYTTLGKQIIADEPDNFNLQMYLINNIYGLSSGKTPVDTYNADAINLAKQAIQKIESGSANPAKWEPYANKNEALAWLNYTVGFMMFKQNGMEKDAAPYFYKAVQIQSPIKDDPNPYRNIGYYYSQEYTKAANDYKAKCVDTPCDEATNKEALANVKGAADRVLDAYARALKVARDKKSPLATDLTKTAQAAYKARFDSDTGLDAYLNSVMSKPMPDPTSPITPIEPTPTTTPATTGATTPTATTGAAAATTPAKPSATAATGTTVRPRTSETAGTGSGTTTTVKPTPVVQPTKPAPKKPTKQN